MSTTTYVFVVENITKYWHFLVEECKYRLVGECKISALFGWEKVSYLELCLPFVRKFHIRFNDLNTISWRIVPDSIIEIPHGTLFFRHRCFSPRVILVFHITAEARRSSCFEWLRILKGSKLCWQFTIETDVTASCSEIGGRFTIAGLQKRPVIWNVLWLCAPSEDSDQPALLHSLIRIFNGCFLDSQGCTGWFESPLGAQVSK